MPEITTAPTGDYSKPAAFHHLDLDADADRLIEALPGNRRKTQSLARESGVSVVMIAMEAGDTLAEHSAPGVVTVQLVRGHATLTVAGETVGLTPGQMLLFQPGVRHDVHAVEQSVVLLTVTGGND